jgi:hypothetical protein
MHIPFWIAKYIEPTASRHALVRDRVWILRELATHPDSKYNLEQFFRLRCIFFHVPKTAGLAVSDALFSNRAAGHIDVETAKALVGIWGFRSFFKFCFVRNPWDRLVSAYHYLRKGHPTSPIAATVMRCSSFAEFVSEALRSEAVASELHIRPQHSFVLDSRGQVVMNFVGRFEHLERDFEAVARHLGLQGRRLHAHNESLHQDYRCYYDDSTQRIVSDFYRKDIELFNYRFEHSSAISESIRSQFDDAHPAK